MYDLIIIGGGPAGVAAGIYASRKKIKTLLITDFFGGQSLVSDDIQNWIGIKSISGFELAKNLEEHLKSQADVEIIEGDLAVKIEVIKQETAEVFKIYTKNGKEPETKTILIASGSHHRRLEVPGEKEFEGKGIFYCSTCDAPFAQNKEAAVIGGGNSALEAAVDLLPYAKKIYLIYRGGALKGDPVIQDKIKDNQKVKIILNAETQKILGKTEITGLEYKDKKTNKTKILPIQAMFVEIGSSPNSDIVKNLVDLNNFGEIVVNHKTQRTSRMGLWAAGDITDVLYKQNSISAGDGVKALLNIHEYLKQGK